MAKRKITTMLIVTDAALIIAISAILAWNHFFDYSYVLEINWGISIPQDEKNLPLALIPSSFM